MNFRRSDLISIAIVVVLLVILAAVWISNRSRQWAEIHRSVCVGQLKQTGLAFRILANDHDGTFPMRLPEAQGGALESSERGDLARIFRVLSNELSVTKTLICPSDDRRIATNWASLERENISRFVGLDARDTKPDLLLAGDRNLATNGVLLTGIAALGTSTNIGYSRDLHDGAGNVVLVDGSVHRVTAALLHQQLLKSGDATNRVLFPQ